MNKQSFPQRIANAFRVLVGRNIPNTNPPDEEGFTPYGRSLSVEANADSIPAAYACINRVSESMARLPRVAGYQTDMLNDEWTADTDHPVSALLANPSRNFDSFQFWLFVFRQYTAHGNGYAWIRRNRKGRPVELVPAYSQAVERRNGRVVRQLQLWTGSLWETSETRNVYEKDLISLNGPGFDGESSPSPIFHAARRTLETMGYINDHNRNELGKGMNLRRVIETAPEMAGFNQQQREELTEELKRGYTGAVNAGQIPVLAPGFKVSGMDAMSAVDLQLIELMRWSVSDICRIFNVPPRMIQQYQDGVRVANNSMEAQAEDYVRWSLSARAEVVNAQLTAKLLTADERSLGMVCRMPVDRLRNGSWSEEVKSVDMAVARSGVLTINEGRRRLGYPDHPDGDRLMSPKGAPAQGDEVNDIDADDELIDGVIPATGNGKIYSNGNGAHTGA